MANTYTYKTTFAKSYQETLYRQPVYRALAREAIAPGLYDGQVLSRSWLSRFSIGELPDSGAYTAQDFTSTAETLTVNHKPYGAFRIVEWQKFLDDLDTQTEAANSCMNQIFNYWDGLVLGAVYSAAGSTMDAADFSGTAGAGISFNTSNVQTIFTRAKTKLILKNATSNGFSWVKRFSGIKQKDAGDRMPVCVIPAQLMDALELSVAGRATPLGDKALTNGFMDKLFGFNIFVSNNLTWVGTYAVTTTNLTTADTLTINGLVLTGTTGTPTNPGDFKVEATGALTAANIANLLNSPYTSISGKSIAWVKTSLTAEQNTMLALTVAAVTATTSVTVTLNGNSQVIVSTTSLVGSWTKQICEAIFGTSQMIDLAIVKDVMLGEPIPVSGSVAMDLVPRSLGGYKVFHEQAPRIVAVALDISPYTQAPSY